MLPVRRVRQAATAALAVTLRLEPSSRPMEAAEVAAGRSPTRLLAAVEAVVSAAQEESARHPVVLAGSPRRHRTAQAVKESRERWRFPLQETPNGAAQPVPESRPRPWRLLSAEVRSEEEEGAAPEAHTQPRPRTSREEREESPGVTPLAEAARTAPMARLLREEALAPRVIRLRAAPVAAVAERRSRPRQRVQPAELAVLEAEAVVAAELG